MKYTESHEWVRVQEGVATVGITEHAQGELGEIVYVAFPQIGKNIEMGQEAAVLESTKAAADVYCPVSGEVVEVNTTLADASELINESPEGEGWIFKIKLTDTTELEKLMDQESYDSLIMG